VFLVDALTGVAQPELREIVLFARSRSRPVSADDVAAEFGVHRSVARGRLDRLAETGLLSVSFERRTGRSGPGAGRPAKLYSVPPETVVLEFPARHFDRLVGHFVDAVPEETLAEVGGGFGQDLAAEARLPRARSFKAAAERACEALRKLGFQASVSDATDRTVTITTPTCPLRPLVVAKPGAATIDRGMWAGLVKAHLPARNGCKVTCETRDCLDSHASCRVVLDFETPAGRST
jgi:predicted ArsR family transcriptional regulator